MISEKDRLKKEKQKKREERSKKFWSSFLFTENGKPKSSFFLYTFCLSAVFVVLYIAAFHFIVDWLAPVTESWPVFLGNLFGSLSCSAVGIVAGWLLHRWFRDKRLIFGTYIWLAVYVIASVITMAIMLSGTDSMSVFLVFALWFAFIPVTLGLIFFFLLFRRDCKPVNKEEEPEWKKYVNRR